MMYFGGVAIFQSLLHNTTFCQDTASSRYSLQTEFQDDSHLLFPNGTNLKVSYHPVKFQN